MKTSEEIRKAFMDFWTSKPRNAKVVPNASLVPNNDPTLLFVNSGMFPLVPYLAGEPHPLGKRLCNVQRCIRTIDIDEVGDYSHLVLFEMVGNWSLGDFTKADQIPWKLELYVEKFALDPKRLYVSVWEGDETVGRDEEAIEIWKKAFKKYGINAKFSEDITNIPKNLKEGETWEYRIFPYGKEDNWWQRGPKVPGELGGPTSEIFYDLGEVQYDEEKYHINDDSGRFLEVGNSVFMEYKVDDNNEWKPLKQKNIDFGGGFERIVIAAQNKMSVYETDIFMPYINKIEEISGKKYNPLDVNSEETIAFRIIAEHARSTTFILGDEVRPGNKDQGYILRRLIRRMIRYGIKIGIEGNFAKDLSLEVIEKMKEAYPHLEENKNFIIDEMEKEEVKFRRTLEKGLREIQKIVDDKSQVTGELAFFMYETYGFPLEMTLEEFNFNEDEQKRIEKEFKEEQKKHQQASRAGAEQKFAGGLADHSDEVTRLHTAHHLLLKALQIVLGEEVKQRGSNITGERLRIDFSYDQKLTDEQVKEVEKIVNKKIDEDLKVTRLEMPKEQAEKIGAEMEFGQKYPDKVSIYFIGGKKKDDIIEDYFSAEFCGGPHVENTLELATGGKRFKIAKQENIGSGKRRIKAKLV